MIGWLQGSFIREIQGGLIMKVASVGYVVFASAKTLGQIPHHGELFELHIETHVREDHIHLYGFYDLDEQELFKVLLSVQGVGARMALSLLSALSPDQVRQAIMAEDKALLTKADGIGPKLGARIISELKDKILSSSHGLGKGAIAIASLNKKDQASSPQSSSSSSSGGDGAASSVSQEEVLSALVNLGYGRSEAYGALMRISPNLGDDERGDIAKVLRVTLKELARPS